MGPELDAQPLNAGAEAGATRQLAEHDLAAAATLPIAALTAWSCLVTVGQLQPGQTVLTLGTGGVSIFALQFAAMHGARAIVTSSSDDKLARASAMGAWQTINYRETPEWDARVRDLTDGKGVDHVVEVGGAGTLEKSIASTRVAGRIALIGVLTGGTANPVAIMRNSLTVHGIYVGSRHMFEAMNRAIATTGLEPVIDSTVPFTEAPAAYHRMRAAGHFGKIVIAMDQ